MASSKITSEIFFAAFLFFCKLFGHPNSDRFGKVLSGVNKVIESNLLIVELVNDLKYPQ